MIFDTHAHYDDEQFDTDRDALLRGMAEQNVGTIINVGASLEGCWRSVELAHQYPFVYAAVGIHPDEVGDLNEESFARLRETARMEEKVVAIGEIGLDYHWDVQPHEVLVCKADGTGERTGSADCGAQQRCGKRYL